MKQKKWIENAFKWSIQIPESPRSINNKNIMLVGQVTYAWGESNHLASTYIYPMHYLSPQVTQLLNLLELWIICLNHTEWISLWIKLQILNRKSTFLLNIEAFQNTNDTNQIPTHKAIWVNVPATVVCVPLQIQSSADNFCNQPEKPSTHYQSGLEAFHLHIAELPVISIQLLSD